MSQKSLFKFCVNCDRIFCDVNRPDDDFCADCEEMKPFLEKHASHSMYLPIPELNAIHGDD